MHKGLTPFGIKVREHRARLGLKMGHQAKALNCSVAYISAIEHGNRPIPPTYIAEVAAFLELSSSNAQELQELANGQRTVVHIAPADGERAQLAFEFALSVNEMPLEQVRQMRRWLQQPTAGRHSIEELRQWATLARRCFELGNKLTFDLIDVLENKVSIIDPSFSLHVVSDDKLGDRVAAYADSTKELWQQIVLSEHTYNAASSQTADGRAIAAHEFAHWLAKHPPATYSHRRTKFDPIEVEADRLAREFLLPAELVERFSTPGQLAMECNVPLWMARLRMKELGVGRDPAEQDRVTAGFSQLLDQLKLQDEKDAPRKSSVTSIASYVVNSAKSTPSEVSNDSSRTLSSVNRNVKWFTNHGWR